MSDNVGYTPGSGATIAADNVGGALHQRVKITHGSDGAAVDVSEATPLPVISYRAEQMLGQLVQATISPPTYDSSLRRQRVTAVVEGTVGLASGVNTIGSVNIAAGQTVGLASGANSIGSVGLLAGSNAIGNITTVATLTDQTNIGGRPGAMLINQTNLSAWADCVRARIT